MTRNRTRAGRERTSRSPTAERGPGRRSSRNRLRKTADLPARDATTGMKAAPAPETVDPLPVKRPSTAAAGGEPRPATEPREASRGRSGFPVLAHRPRRPRSRRARPSGDRRRPAAGGRRHDRARRRRRHRDRGDRSGRLNRRGGDRRRTLGTVVDTAGTVVDTAGTVVDTVGTMVDTVDTTVDTVDTTVDTGGTVVGTVVGTVGTVTVALSGRADASTFATKKPDTAKQTSTTSVLHLTTFISPSAECPCTQQELLAPPANLVTRELEAR